MSFLPEFFKKILPSSFKDSYMDKYIDNYLTALSKANYAANTIEFYSRYLPFFNNIAISKFNTPIYKLKVSQLLEFKDNYMSNYSASSQNSFFGMLKGLQNYLIADGSIDYISVVPLLYNKLDVNYSLSFNPNEFHRLKSLSTNRMTWASFCALVCTGLRISELESLALNDINFVTNNVYVTRSKSRASRKVELLQIPMLSDFKDYISIITPITDNVTPFLFAKPAIRYLIDKYNDTYNTSYTTHNTRSTYATLMYRRHIPLVDIQRYLGHKNLKTTLKYIDSYERII